MSEESELACINGVLAGFAKAFIAVGKATNTILQNATNVARPIVKKPKKK